MNISYHIPVLAKESVGFLITNPDGIYVDTTFGGGGHTRLMLDKLGKNARIIAFDQDEDAIRNAPVDNRLTLIHGNFRFLSNYLKYLKIKKINGLLADLGVSSYHFDNPERGFTFRADSLLDMRMNRKSTTTAVDIINHYDEEKLLHIFKNYGEIENASRLTRTILEARSRTTISTASELRQCILSCIPKGKENKYLAKVFQAIRIEVNDEIEALKEMLTSAAQFLKPQGRLVVITYHSLEDRLVKNFIKYGNFEGTDNSDLFGNRKRIFKNVNKDIVTPGEEEMLKNTRSRSAKLRVAEKNED